MEDIVVEYITRKRVEILVQKASNRHRKIFETKRDLIDSGKLDTDGDDKSNPEDDK